MFVVFLLIYRATMSYTVSYCSLNRRSNSGNESPKSATVDRVHQASVLDWCLWSGGSSTNHNMSLSASLGLFGWSSVASCLSVSETGSSL